MSVYTDKTKESMNKSIDALRANFGRIRTGRANPQVLDPISVVYYGTPSPISQIASIKVVDASTLIIEPWDKQILKDIESALERSDLGITPSNTGDHILLPFPKPTEERRRELAKDCNQLAEEARVSIRNIRRDFNGKVDRDEEYSDDDKAREKKNIQKLTDDFVALVDELLKAKVAEVMEI